MEKMWRRTVYAASVNMKKGAQGPLRQVDIEVFASKSDGLLITFNLFCHLLHCRAAPNDYINHLFICWVLVFFLNE